MIVHSTDFTAVNGRYAKFLHKHSLHFHIVAAADHPKFTVPATVLPFHIVAIGTEGKLEV